MKKYTSRMLALAAAMFLSACALTVDTVEVPYKEPTSIASIGADGKMFQVNVLDLRAKYKGRIGAKINGFGAEMADIKSTIPVRDIVANALQSELKARNIKISETDTKAIEAEITSFHNNFKFGAFSGKASSIVRIIVKVMNSSGTVMYENTISETNELSGIMIATGENAAKALEGALQRTMDSLFDDQNFIKALVDA